MERAKGWIASVPNVLSALRLALAVAFPFLPPGGRLPAVIAAGFTDWFDGFIARRYHAQSVLGGLLDGIADKAFTLSVLVTLAARGQIAPWQVAVVLLRDIAVLVVCLYFALRGQWSAFDGMPSRWAGKVTTALLFVWVIALLAGAPAYVTLPLFVLLGLSSATAAVDYLRQFVRALGEDYPAPRG